MRIAAARYKGKGARYADNIRKCLLRFDELVKKFRADCSRTVQRKGSEI
uniref:Uncharacterized protein n=1 Tax=Siphoviridae sp. ct91l7 TaxID=2826173 RepID=A0A8S5MXS1_9CAUD|nr:MAG TPA: hypothetical protein [Siphoviridae sp. ct91l7]